MEKVHLFVATPCYGGLVTHYYVSSLLKLQGACFASGVELSTRLLGGDALIPRARNILVEQFLVSEATHLLFIDADIGYPAEQVFRLIKADKDIAGAAYPLKGEVRGKLSYVVGFTDQGVIQQVNGFARADYLGNGFMLIKRDVFARMAAHYPAIAYRETHTVLQNYRGPEGLRYAYFDCMIDPQTGHYLSEDFTFCKRWTEMGGEIWVDLDSKLVHIGPYEFHGDLMSSLQRAPPS